MILIVGLGNPEEKYLQTRHNLGFLAIDSLARHLNGSWKMDKKINCQLSLPAGRQGLIHSQLILAKPQTFMNASGFAVVKIAAFYKIIPSDIWVIHDELDLPLGKIKITRKGGSAGHRGIASISEQLGSTEFVRFRLGIGHPGRGSSEEKVADYVLSGFSSKDIAEIRKMIKKTIDAVRLAQEKGINEAMNRFNL